MIGISEQAMIISDPFEFSELLSRFLDREERSPSWLARNVGVHRSTVSRWLEGQSRPSDIEKVIHIASSLRLSPDELNKMLSSCNFPHKEVPSSILEKADSKQPITEEASRINFKTIGQMLQENPYKSVNSQYQWSIQTGFSDIDRLLGGLHKSYLITVAGRPGMGRKRFALTIALLAALIQSKHVGVTLEMSSRMVTTHFLSLVLGVASSTLEISLEYVEGERFIKNYPASLRQATSQLAHAPIYINDTPLVTISQYRDLCLNIRKEFGLDLAVVDLHNLISSTDSPLKRTDEIYALMRGLKALAGELDIPILVITELDPRVDGREEKRPQLKDIPHYNTIGTFIDIALIIYRDEYYFPETTDRPNIAEIHVPKHRNGPTGTVDLFFHGYSGSFRNLELRQIDDRVIAYPLDWNFNETK